MVNALLSQLFLECVAGLNDRKGCIFTNDMKLTRQNMKYFVFILSAMKVNLEITTFFFYLRFPYCPNFFWFRVVEQDPDWLTRREYPPKFRFFNSRVSRESRGKRPKRSIRTASFARTAPQDVYSRLCIDLTCKSLALNASFVSGVNAPLYSLLL